MRVRLEADSSYGAWEVGLTVEALGPWGRALEVALVEWFFRKAGAGPSLTLLLGSSRGLSITHTPLPSQKPNQQT